jgi:hypothetical protein
MDGLRFDTWARRRFGLVAASLVTAALGGLPRRATLARGKHKKPKKRCVKLGAVCTPGGRKCCKFVTCNATEGGPRCCREHHEACTVGTDCCSGNCDGGICSEILV